MTHHAHLRQVHTISAHQLANWPNGSLLRPHYLNRPTISATFSRHKARPLRDSAPWSAQLRVVSPYARKPISGRFQSHAAHHRGDPNNLRPIGGAVGTQPKQVPEHICARTRHLHEGTSGAAGVSAIANPAASPTIPVFIMALPAAFAGSSYSCNCTDAVIVIVRE